MERIKQSAGGLAVVLSLMCSCGAPEPTDGSVGSASACELDWRVASVVPCIAAPNLGMPPLIYSSHLNASGQPTCDPYVGFPQPVPEDSWSSQTLISESAGSAKLCISLKRGKAEAPTPADCALFTYCQDVTYAEPGELVQLADLPGWSTQDEACARAYYSDGGYVEMQVTSRDLGCSADGQQVVRIQMCPNDCEKDDPREKCDPCKFGVTTVTGSF